jgi:hypothetical protein
MGGELYGGQDPIALGPPDRVDLDAVERVWATPPPGMRAPQQLILALVAELREARQALADIAVMAEEAKAKLLKLAGES